MPFRQDKNPGRRMEDAMCILLCFRNGPKSSYAVKLLQPLIAFPECWRGRAARASMHTASLHRPPEYGHGDRA